MLEQQILDAIGDAELHGYAIARTVQDRAGTKMLAAHGTLYRALSRLEGMGKLTSRWEDEGEQMAGRPRRRLYRRPRRPKEATSDAP